MQRIPKDKALLKKISKSKVATYKKEETIYRDQDSIGLEPQELEITELSDKNYYRMVFKIIINLKNWKHEKELDTIKKHKADWKKNQTGHLEMNILVTGVKTQRFH